MGRAVPLQRVLRRFEQAYARAPQTLGRVACDVQRTTGFGNEALTPAGLQIVLDEPADFGGSGQAPDPAEHLLAAVGASLSVTLTAHAALRGVPLDDVHVALEGFIDGKLFFDPTSDGRPGVHDIRLTLTVTSRAPRSVLRTLLRDVLRVCPVLRSLKRMPAVELVHVAGADA